MIGLYDPTGVSAWTVIEVLSVRESKFTGKMYFEIVIDWKNTNPANFKEFDLDGYPITFQRLVAESK